ncbi:MAG: 2'-5' RNA ligase [Mesorhizobium sp.]|uniref:2'-5' RNA ligase family protein n=1 Tax=Mesorhizobium sp. TaxID=1871066 RepID=UPI0012276E8A|nr:2'-5' RNA ligase family protein [Mesorhizobium sp.]TIR15068.1 MAG: 2'-5' RNA ligase [Mesorhizobium sp.]
MNEQPWFGIGRNGQAFFRWDHSSQDPTDRLFFAILVEGTIAHMLASRALAWQRELGLGGKLIRAGHLHISLVMLGDHDGLPKPLVDAACSAGSLVQARAFDVSFDRLSPFGGGALVLRRSDGVPALQAFWQALAAVLSDSSFKPLVGKSIEPHVTLLRDKARVPRVDERPIEPIGWTVQEFVLIHSFLRQDRHQIIRRWQLNSQDDAHAVM